MSARIVTFGEIMMRLKSPNHEKLLQTPGFEVTFAGGEANVAVSLANYGIDASFVTALPENDIADACVGELRRFGVDVSSIRRSKGRMGIYFVEAGANQRPSKVIYDRDYSSIARVGRGEFDWESIFRQACWFHITGITPALSASCAEASIEAVETAKKMGLTVSIDLNYRAKLWNYGKKAWEVMPDIVKYADVIIANEEDCQKALNIKSNAAVDSGNLVSESYRDLCREVLEKYPNVKKVAITLRESKSADHNNWSACVYNGVIFHRSKTYEIRDIVDRVGGGDSFSGGLIYGLMQYEDIRTALEFAVAASCLKHSIMGDFNRVKTEDVMKLMGGDATGRVQR